MKKILFIVITMSLITYSLQLSAQGTTLVNWMSFEEAVEKQQQEPKTILISFYTDWCGWCKRMDETTFSEPSTAMFINNHFYPVKFDAETMDTIEYMGNVYINEGVGRRPSHQLAQALMGGRMSYPTTVYIDDEFRTYPVPGYMEPARIEQFLVYFAERINKAADFVHFEKDFKNTFDSEFNEDTDGVVEWLELDEALGKFEEDPKKMIIFFNSDFVNGSKIMEYSVFKHPVISDYLNNEFYTVRIDFDTQDTLSILGRTFVNEQNEFGYPHQLTIALLQPEIRLPAMVFFDSEQNLVSAIRGYLPAITLEKYLSFIGQKLYLTDDWEKFSNNFESEIDVSSN